MTSSMLSGERRWASSRRSGMTVLGKVAVPKPINLPSQRLENHGLDPNVEIVPKGTLSWGSRSSSASNAWGSSSLSPNTDGGAGSPSHLSARPSSGGSGTRPSTAGSDKTVEHTAGAWGSNSRPSSASGALTSNQTSISSVRPHSAETRPGSSQLSRFAEHTTEISGAWNSARTTEKLGVAQAKNNEFSLSSGDFPTLGSEKDNSVKNSELKDHNSHSRPGSSSGLGKVKTESSVVDDVPVNANVKDGAVNSWRRDYPAFSEDGVRPSIEKQQGNPPLYSNPGIPPQHYDTWHGPTMNNPQGGVWYRGPPGGPPFGNPVAPAGFSVEPFTYYRPHIPPGGLANPPPVPPPGPGPRGPHPKNGDVYMPHMPDAYIRPSMPIRPGFYPGPIPYEGYYSLPMGYHNSNERDVPFMGMASGPHVYNRYLNQNPTEPSNPQGRSGRYGSAGKALTSEQVESSWPPDAGGPFRVLLKQHEWDEKKEQSQLEDPVGANESNTDKRDQPRNPVLENEPRSDYRKNEEMDLRAGTRVEEVSSLTLENQGSGPSVIKSRSLHSAGNIKLSEDAASGVLELPLRPSAPKDSSLIQKIEGLNAKVRDNSSGKNREEQRNKFHGGSAPVNHQSKETGAGAAFPERGHTAEVINPPPHEVGASGGEKKLESSSFSGTATDRQTTQAMQVKADYRNKGKIAQDADRWQKKSVIADSPTLLAAELEFSSVHIGDHRISVENYDKSRSYHQTRLDGQSMQTMSDSSDSEAQRAKVKELVKQRTKQLQEEEEERTRQQKAKAHAKLDELNRRAQVVEGSMQESATGDAFQNKQEELRPSDLASVSGKSGAPDSAITCNANVDCQISETSSYKVEKSSILPSKPPFQTLENVVKEPVLSHDPSTIIHQDVKSADVTSGHVHNSIASKHKRMGYKQKQTQSSDRTSNQKIVSTLPTAPKDENDTVVPSGGVTNEISQTFDSGLPINSNALMESSANQKRKNYRNGKNKQKVEETSPLEASPSAMPKEAKFSKSSVETDHPKALESEVDQDAVQPSSFSKDHNQNSVQQRHSANEEYHSRTNSQWKSHHSHRVPRNTQSNRPAEKFHGNEAVMWAPVKSQNKTEIMDELSDKSKIDAVNPVKGDQPLHNFSKNKRAEMERYIPKPFAKEMAQHVNIQQVPSINQITSVEIVGQVDSGSQGPQDTQAANSAVGKVGSGMESKNVDGRLSKQGKAHGSWRQRGSTESTNMHDMPDGVNPNSRSDHSVQKSSGHQHGQTSETSAAKGQMKHHASVSDLDGTSNSNSHDSLALVSNPVMKDQIPAGRGKRVPFRGHKSIGVNHDADLKKNGDETEKIESQISTSEPSQADTGAAYKENRGMGERMISHWQPKSQPFNYQRGNRPNKHNVGSEVSQVSRKDYGVSSLSAGCDKEPNDHSAPTRDDQSIVSEKNKAGEPPNVGNQEFKRERRNAPPKGHPQSPNQVPLNHDEQAPTNMDVRHEQRSPSGFRKNGNQNRFGRGQESRGDWASQGQGNRHYSLSANREKQGQNLHYEYHPVGPYDNNKSDSLERSKDGNHSGVKFRERGQMHSRRGGANSNGRQVGGFD